MPSTEGGGQTYESVPAGHVRLGARGRTSSSGVAAIVARCIPTNFAHAPDVDEQDEVPEVLRVNRLR
jgi:hypothetical protein